MKGNWEIIDRTLQLLNPENKGDVEEGFKGLENSDVLKDSGWHWEGQAASGWLKFTGINFEPIVTPKWPAS